MISSLLQDARDVHSPAIIGPWRKSSRSLGPDIKMCVELAPTVVGRAIRDSKHGADVGNNGPVLYFSEAAFVGLLTMARRAAV